MVEPIEAKATSPSLANALKEWKDFILGGISISSAILVHFQDFVQSDQGLRHATLIAIGVIVLLVFLLTVLPWLRRQKERRTRIYLAPGSDPTYFSTSPRTSHDMRLFNQYHLPFIPWVRTPAAPLLFLTGVSGAGKSSLINGFIKPTLEDVEKGPRTRVLVVRAYEDPLTRLRDELTTAYPNGAFASDPVGLADSLSTIDSQIPEGERLLIILDQFEEFFLLRSSPNAGGETASMVVDPFVSETFALKEFFKSFLSKPPKRAGLVLSYRSDCQRLIDSLELDARTAGKNWLNLDTLPELVVKDFINGCPGMTVPEGRMKRILEEAKRQERGQLGIRPIVANILGLIIQRSADDPEDRRNKTDLLRGYVMSALGKEVNLIRASICKALLSDFRTAKPIKVRELSRETGIAVRDIEDHLLAMSKHGLVRCLNEDQKNPADRSWQIAHDFIADLLERVVHGIQPGLKRAVRPWVAPSLVALTAAMVFIYSREGRDPVADAITAINSAGLFWDKTDSTIIVTKSELTTDSAFLGIQRHLAVLQPLAIELDDCDSLSSISELNTLRSLRYLSISGCDSLITLSGIHDLPGLNTLRISGCTGLKNLFGLGQLSQLNRLEIRDCHNFIAIDGLSHGFRLDSLEIEGCNNLKRLDGLDKIVGLTRLIMMTDEDDNFRYFLGFNNFGDSIDLNILGKLIGLQSLVLKGYAWSSDLAPLRHLTNLTHLSLTNDQLKDLNGLHSLTSLVKLDLSDCRSLSNLQGLRLVPQLDSLVLHNCTDLADVGTIGALPGLTYLDISADHRFPTDLEDNEKVLSLYGLQGHPQLTTLILEGRMSVLNLTGLSKLPALKVLNLRSCDNLVSLSGLHDMPQLGLIDASGCDRLKEISGLHDFPSLKSMIFVNCDSLMRVKDLSGLPSLEMLNLRFSRRLNDLGGLKGVPSLDSLRVGAVAIGAMKAIVSVPELLYLDLGQWPPEERAHPIDPLMFGQMQKLKHLSCTGGSPVSAACIGQCGGLRSLELYGWSDVTDLSFVSGLLGLRRLEVRGFHDLKDLGALAELPDLVALNLSMDDGIKDIEPLTRAQSLHCIGFVGCDGITPEARSRLQKALPDARFIDKRDDWDELMKSGACDGAPPRSK
jgi:Leucine-rich repeat (LRR) protein